MHSLSFKAKSFWLVWVHEKEYNFRGISCRKNMGYHTMDPRIRTQGAIRVRSRSQWNTVMEASRRQRAQRTIERDTELYPGSGPSLWGKTPTSCLLVLWRDTSRGVQGIRYRALTGRRLKNQLSLARSSKIRIRSVLRGSFPSFYSAEVLLPLINLGKGLPQMAKERDSCCLQSSVDVVFVE
jgi:hypothetical protein